MRDRPSEMRAYVPARRCSRGHSPWGLHRQWTEVRLPLGKLLLLALLSIVGEPSGAAALHGPDDHREDRPFPLRSRDLVPKPLADIRGSGTRWGWG